jgi:hypothetical protein
MAQSIITALNALTATCPLNSKWCVGIFVINPQPQSGQCGLYTFHSIYDTQNAAQEMACKLNEDLGHPSITFRARQLGQFHEFDEATVTTLFHSNDSKDESINKIMAAKAEAEFKSKQRKDALAAQIAAESTDPNAQLAQLIYQAQFNDLNAESNRNQAEKMETTLAALKIKIADMLRQHPLTINGWRNNIKPILQQHDDISTYNYMVSWFDTNFPSKITPDKKLD